MPLFLPVFVTAIRGVGYDGLDDRNSCDFARALVTRDGLLVPGDRAQHPGDVAKVIAAARQQRPGRPARPRVMTRRCDSVGDGYAIVKISRGGRSS